jgi:hypothetical protein
VVCFIDPIFLECKKYIEQRRQFHNNNRPFIPVVANIDRLLYTSTIMLSSRCIASAARVFSRNNFSGLSAVGATTSPSYRTFVTSVKEAATADDALRFSGYSAIDFTIPEDAPVYDAVQKFAAFNIGCLVTVDTAGTFLVFVELSSYLIPPPTVLDIMCLLFS